VDSVVVVRTSRCWLHLCCRHVHSMFRSQLHCYFPFKQIAFYHRALALPVGGLHLIADFRQLIVGYRVDIIFVTQTAH